MEGLHPNEAEQYDLLVVVDATASMHSFLKSLNNSLRQIISISELTRCFSRIGLLAYRDYVCKDLLEWSGWFDTSLTTSDTQPDLLTIAASLDTQGNYDVPEAAKTGLAKAYEVMRSDAKTVILFYADAPPHAWGNNPNLDNRGPDENHGREQIALSISTCYGGFGPKFKDWVSACNLLREGEKRVQVFCILDPSMCHTYNHASASYYTYLSTMTQGSCIVLRSAKPSAISKVTIEVLLTWMGVGKPAVDDVGEETSPYLLSYPDLKGIDKFRDERDEEARSYLPTPDSHRLAGSLKMQRLSPYIMHNSIQKKTAPVADFTKSWATDPSYQALAVKHLKQIIIEDVTVIAVNAIFATLWRNICTDRAHPARSELLNAFSLQVSHITDPVDRSRMTDWLEASYDYTGEVVELINTVPETERFPCVCLDPTLTFTHPDHDENENYKKTATDITTFTRAELLEMGRSCDPDILRRLSRVLTQLTYIQSPADLPEHIASMTDRDMPRIPIALAKEQYKRKFWQILLHIVCPGTMLSTRPSSVLAALALRLGITPLLPAAESQLLTMKDRWNDIEVPETWTISCMTLLLDADRKYQQRQSLNQTTNDTGDSAVTEMPTVLKTSDRELFEKLIAYRFLELNLHTTFTAQIGWKPEKTLIPIGPVVTCKSCHYPRSVTIMGHDGQCGVCLGNSTRAHCSVTKDDTDKTPAAWVECHNTNCRAQYVVYDVESLRVRPKCHYCRVWNAAVPSTRDEVPLAPCVECHRCLSRIIWPEPYRPAGFVEAEYLCPGCTTGRQTIVDVETSAEQLKEENTVRWFIQDTKQPSGHTFSNRSLFHTVSRIGPDKFVAQIMLFPDTNPHLTIRGKLVRNSESIISKLQDHVSRRRSVKVACSLCFSNFHPTALSSACSRRGCQERICKECLSQWYGLNAPGRIINTAALSCPFCRRLPSARTLAKHGMGIHAVGNLQGAIQDRGTWIYVWCRSCATAKPYLERVCAQGAPPEVTNWRCEECIKPGESAVKPCPGCGVMTEKISGCGHIQCEVEDCHTHWCYFCGDKFDKGLIYSHMTEIHGTIYDQEDGLDYDLDDENDN
ncbi:hypothetical protein ETB97_012750 [Aspergillus alliaceus]|uniref:RBR-type E3 ubiquitin transferase n=1 Tax=Petromyces alliaceus TaxID=209559 RepID=A0A8H6E859_PETAA|nr:hypothetical protein ETB97_012750 [Aspergillus burnettii]